MKFAPLININHPQHPDTIIDFPHLSNYIAQQQHHPPPWLLFAFVTTLSPTLATCDYLLIQTPELDWTTILLERITQLPNLPEGHITITQPYTQFLHDNHKYAHPEITIHTKLYRYIQLSTISPNLQQLINKIPLPPYQPTHRSSPMY